MSQIQDEDVEALTSLGLTVLQAKVYLALAKSGTSTIKEISQTSGVFRQDLYRITSELQKLDLVEKVLSVPNKYKAIELRCGISILLNRAHEKQAEMHKEAQKLIQRYKESAKPEKGEAQFIMIPGKEVALKVSEAMENAETRMFSVVSWKKFSTLMLNARKFRLGRTLKRGLTIRFITGKPEDEKQIPKILETYRKRYSFEVRYLMTDPLAHIGLFDKNEVFINTSTKAGLAETPLLWSNSPSLVAVVHDYLEILWLTSMEKSKQET
jgi:sugar-specific transcriptional regulator TrmB